jgi:hypothetical protein
MYKNCLSNLRQAMKIKILSEFTDLSINRQVNNMTYAEASIQDFENIITNSKAIFLNFVASKLDAFSAISFKDAQEFPEGEELDDNDFDEEEVILPFAADFLIIYFIEFFLLDKHPEKLEDYLKHIRVGHAKKYAKDLKNIYSRIKNS